MAEGTTHRCSVVIGEEGHIPLYVPALVRAVPVPARVQAEVRLVVKENCRLSALCADNVIIKITAQYGTD
jgi:hypothetical protein